MVTRKGSKVPKLWIEPADHLNTTRSKWFMTHFGPTHNRLVLHHRRGESDAALPFCSRHDAQWLNGMSWYDRDALELDMWQQVVNGE